LHQDGHIGATLLETNSTDTNIET
jgi:hypothetical protein